MAVIPAAQRRAMVYDDTVSIRVNGEHRRVPKGMTIAELALELGLEPTRVAVERNLEIVPRSTLGEVKVEDGDDFEIVTFVGGG
jgi:thiamine biosynthesis protein ThiS